MVDFQRLRAGQTGCRQYLEDIEPMARFMTTPQTKNKLGSGRRGDAAPGAGDYGFLSQTGVLWIGTSLGGGGCLKPSTVQSRGLPVLS